jgi:hypothetical protein
MCQNPACHESLGLIELPTGRGGRKQYCSPRCRRRAHSLRAKQEAVRLQEKLQYQALQEVKDDLVLMGCTGRVYDCLVSLAIEFSPEVAIGAAWAVYWAGKERIFFRPTMGRSMRSNAERPLDLDDSAPRQEMSAPAFFQRLSEQLS